MGTKTTTARKNRSGIEIHQGKVDKPHGDNAAGRSQLQDRARLLDDDDPDLPALPAADARGRYPALATARVIIARQLIRGRKAAGWTQAELAARAGVRPETIRRIETGQHSPSVKTMAKIDRALQQAQV